jgi:hypothetical protein
VTGGDVRGRASQRIERSLVRGIRTALLGVALLVLCVIALPQPLLYPQRYDPLALHSIAFVVLLTVGAVGLWREVRALPLSAGFRWAGFAATVVAAVVNGFTLDSTDVLQGEHWTFGVCGWFCVYLLFGARLRALAAALGVHLVVAAGQIVVHGLPPRAVAAALAISVVNVYGFQLAVGAFASVLRGTAESAAVAAAADEELRTREAVAESLHRDHEDRLRSLLATTVPLLRGLADRTLDPGDPVTVRRCAVEAARMRRLHVASDEVADSLVHELAAILDVADRRGITAQLEVSGTPRTVPEESRRDLLDPLSVVLSAARTAARLTVAYTSTAVRVSIVADGPETVVPPTGTTVRVQRVDAPGTVWVETTWAAP